MDARGGGAVQVLYPPLPPSRVPEHRALGVVVSVSQELSQTVMAQRRIALSPAAVACRFHPHFAQAASVTTEGPESAAPHDLEGYAQGVWLVAAPASSSGCSRLCCASTSIAICRACFSWGTASPRLWLSCNPLPGI